MHSLAALLRCPQCGGRVNLADDVECDRGHHYPLVDGIPVFVSEESIAATGQYAGQRAYFDAEFALYERYRLENWRVAYLERLRAAGLLAGQNAPLIDVGVGGSGYTVIEAARSGRSAIGCDLSLTGLQAARRFADTEGVADSTLWVCCSAERLPFASESFAAALAIAVLEHVPDVESAWRELARVLLRGGRAWVTVPHALAEIPVLLRPANRRHDRRLGHLRRYDRDTIVGDAERAGLQPVELQFTGHPVKVVQFLAGRMADAVWWWCERRDQRRRHVPRGSMQLSAVFARP